ncbi:MAG: DNA ligase D [Syntrophomonadaceae bacterium]|nr:DNA ligase D [Syntrophomonadaceae bacterium]
MPKKEQENDPLGSYKDKRNFAVTPEPAGGPGSSGAGLAFVIQKHDARSTHYDLRLELDGVLKSWAVPKGPSQEPGQKRLAVRVEDHPLEYLEFEGTVPVGQYGAGGMFIWDRGIWEPIGDPVRGLDEGHLKFYLHGEKLQGAWVLVQMHSKSGEDKNWLLIKEKHDGYRGGINLGKSDPATNPAAPESLLLSLPPGARPAPVPTRLTPQLATLVEQTPVGDEWVYEIKLDGYRILAYFQEASVRFYTRNGHDWTDKLNSLVEPLQKLKVAPGWLDGEIVIPGDDGAPDFGALQAAFEAGRTSEIVYYVFDMPFYAGYDLRPASLTARRLLLAGVMQESNSSRLRFSQDFSGSGDDILRIACDMGLEGVMGKKKDAAYVSGRTQSWIKLKCSRRQEFVVAGYTSPTTAGRGFKSLVLGVHDDSGQLRYAGKVGTGFNARNAGMIMQQLERLAAEQSPLVEIPKGIQANWLRPELVAEVSFREWTKDGRVRHGVFHGLRTDKAPTEITREELASGPGPSASPIKTAHLRKKAEEELNLPKITNPDRVVDSATSLTKLDLVNYYRQAAQWLLPHLQDRPVAFLRAPEGVGGEMFFQKHGEKLKITGLRHLDPELDPGHPSLMAVETLEALIGAVQMNVIEFHTWNAVAKRIEKPDRMVFDLDPGEEVGWAMIAEAAQLTRALLEELELQSFLKTSGGKGLHVVVPLKRRDDWETVKAFSKGVASHLARVIPGRFTDISGPRNRVGKIFIDYNRNGCGATTVAAYSARARAGLGVSMPCAWQELSKLTGGDQWNVTNAHLRWEESHDPWQDYGQTKQVIKAASKKIMLGH